MNTVSMRELLQADEESIRGTLRANKTGGKGRDACAAMLSEELGRLLLHYNAACGSNRQQQAAADCLAASVRDTVDFLRCGRAEQGKKTREIPGLAILLLFGALLLGAAAVLIARKAPVYGAASAALALVCAFAAGRLWFREREGAVQPALDPDAVWQVLTRTVETMDRKLEDFAAQSRELEQDIAGGEESALDSEELKLFGSLLEALYADNGPFALKQLAAIPEYLDRRGVTLADYSAENESLFECLPTRRESATQRPALLAGDKLLLAGRAAKHE